MEDTTSTGFGEVNPTDPAAGGLYAVVRPVAPATSADTSQPVAPEIAGSPIANMNAGGLAGAAAAPAPPIMTTREKVARGVVSALGKTGNVAKAALAGGLAALIDSPAPAPLPFEPGMGGGWGATAGAYSVQQEAAKRKQLGLENAMKQQQLDNELKTGVAQRAMYSAQTAAHQQAMQFALQREPTLEAEDRERLHELHDRNRAIDVQNQAIYAATTGHAIGSDIETIGGANTSGAPATDAHHQDLVRGTTFLLDNGQPHTDKDSQAGLHVIPASVWDQPITHPVEVIKDWKLDPKGDATPIKFTAQAGTKAGDLLAMGMAAKMSLDMQQAKLLKAAEVKQKLADAETAAQGADPLTRLENKPEELVGERAPAAMAQLIAKLQNPNLPADQQIRVKNLISTAQAAMKFETQLAASKKRAEQAATEGNAGAMGEMLFNGLLAPSELPGKFRPEFAGAAIRAADAYGKAHGAPELIDPVTGKGTGHYYNAAKADAQYSYAHNASVQTTLNMIASMTDKNGALDIAENAAKNLPQFNEQTLNKVFNAVATEFGSPEATNFHAAMLGLADQYSKVLSAQGSDTSRQQSLDLLKDAYSKGQLAGTISVIRQDIAARQHGIVRDNPTLLNIYGDPMRTTGPAGGFFSQFGGVKH
jgi:hypothetical protein